MTALPCTHLPGCSRSGWPLWPGWATTRAWVRRASSRRSVFRFVTMKIPTSCDGKYPRLLQINDDADCIRYTQNHDVSTLVGDGTSASVGQLSSSWGAPLVSAVMVSIILNLVNFSIIYYQVSPGHSLAATTINLLSMPCMPFNFSI